VSCQAFKETVLRDIEGFYRDSQAVLSGGMTSVAKDITYLVGEIRRLTASEAALRERVSDLEGRLFLSESMRK
jgi:hypothetical protein